MSSPSMSQERIYVPGRLDGRKQTLRVIVENLVMYLNENPENADLIVDLLVCGEERNSTIHITYDLTPHTIEEDDDSVDLVNAEEEEEE